MRESQEVKRLRSAEPSLPTVSCGIPPELNESGLVRVYLQFELSESLLYDTQEAFRVPLVLKSRHEIVGVTRDDCIAFYFAAAPLLLEPQIENVVQVYVCQDRLWEPYSYGNLSPCGR